MPAGDTDLGKGQILLEVVLLAAGYLVALDPVTEECPVRGLCDRGQPGLQPELPALVG